MVRLQKKTCLFDLRSYHVNLEELQEDLPHQVLQES